MPVNVGPLELAILQSLPLLCGGSILLALIVIAVRLGRRQPSTIQPPTPPDKDS